VEGHGQGLICGTTTICLKELKINNEKPQMGYGVSGPKLNWTSKIQSRSDTQKHLVKFLTKAMDINGWLSTNR